MLKSLEFWALILSLIAIIISLYTWYKSYQIEKDRRTEEKRDRNSAVIRAHLERHRQSMGNIVIENLGQSEARNVQVILDDIPILKHNSIFDPTKSHPLIGPNSQVVYKINVTKDNPPPSQIDISWDDDYSNGNTYRNSLSY